MKWRVEFVPLERLEVELQEATDAGWVVVKILDRSKHLAAVVCRHPRPEMLLDEPESKPSGHLASGELGPLSDDQRRALARAEMSLTRRPVARGAMSPQQAAVVIRQMVFDSQRKGRARNGR
jgi:hypothetical protein